MKFSIGDLVVLKRTGEEGRVVSFLSATMMEVEVDGVHFPVYNEEIDHPYLGWFTEKKKTAQKLKKEIPVEKPSNRAARLARGLYLSFMPLFTPGFDEVIESFKVYFLNETPEAVSISYDAKEASGGTIFRHKGKLHAFGHMYLHRLSLEEINAQPRLHWELCIEKKKERPVMGMVRIRPAQLVKFIQEMLEENQPAFSIFLAEEPFNSALPEKVNNIFPVLPIGSAGPKSDATNVFMKTSAEPVIDLHINTLITDRTGMSADEILHIQLNHLQQKLHAAITAGLLEMIVIHGVGKGTLKQRVHQYLRETPVVASFSNHWMSGYGWGATLITFETS